MKVQKKSGKPFKFGARVATVKCLTTNTQTGLPAYRLEEDLSLVDIRDVEEVKEDGENKAPVV